MRSQASSRATTHKIYPILLRRSKTFHWRQNRFEILRHIKTLGEGFHQPPPPTYHGGRTLRVRPRVNPCLLTYVLAINVLLIVDQRTSLLTLIAQQASKKSSFFVRFYRNWNSNTRFYNKVATTLVLFAVDVSPLDILFRWWLSSFIAPFWRVASLSLNRLSSSYKSIIIVVSLK